MGKASTKGTGRDPVAGVPWKSAQTGSRYRYQTSLASVQSRSFRMIFQMSSRLEELPILGITLGEAVADAAAALEDDDEDLCLLEEEGLSSPGNQTRKMCS